MKQNLFVPTIKSSLAEWLYYIEHLNKVSIDLNVDRVLKIAINLDLIHPAECVILVGGTNGKGTTCCLLETILLKNNNTVGLYTSPHLLEYNERVRVCGKVLPNSVHVAAMSVVENHRNDIALTYFEFITLSALYIFQQLKLDVVILEVGLGGRLDATNVVDTDISVITNIAIDHTDFLGTSRNLIAQEKSGIFRSNKFAVIGDGNYPIIMDKIAENCGAILFARGRDWNFYVYENKWLWRRCSSYDDILCDLPLPIIPLENAATALSALQCLSFSVTKTAICHGLQIATLLGRFQIINYRPLIILDVGHNPHAADYVARRLSVIFSKRTGCIRVVIGMLKSKDIQGTIWNLRRLAHVWYCSDLDTPFSASSTELSAYLIDANVRKFNSILDAWDSAISDATLEDCILVFGSFHAVGPIIKRIMNSY